MQSTWERVKNTGSASQLGAQSTAQLGDGGPKKVANGYKDNKRETCVRQNVFATV